MIIFGTVILLTVLFPKEISSDPGNTQKCFHFKKITKKPLKNLSME